MSAGGTDGRRGATNVEAAARQFRFHDKGGRFPRRGELERDPQTEPNGATAIDALLGEGLYLFPEVVVGSNIMYEHLLRRWIHADIEVAQECEWAAATSVIVVR